jgi:2-hydroxy-3-oxopropionate reductase
MDSLAGQTIGFIGLDLMGRPMARNLHRAGALMIVHNRSSPPMQELAVEGMHLASSPAETAERADIIITMLTDTPAVEQVITGENGLLEAIRPETLIIDMSTTKLPVTRELAARIEAKGCAFIDAPVSGGTIGAEQGTLIIMVGGERQTLDRAMPIFDVLGSRTTHVGATGAGQVAKAANQVIVGLNIGAVAEALTLARRAGVDPARVRDALAGGFADSRILEVHGQRMVDDSFAPGARATVQRKDMDQALQLADELGFELPATALSRDLYDKLIDAGHGDLDHAALIKAIDPDA